jgi:large subunit ribosomal protein L9
MQVILFENIERLGMQGDVVNVAPGYYRNYLGPRGVAVEATARALSRLELKRKKLQAEAEKQLAGARDLSSRLNDVVLKFVMKATDGTKLFGSVSASEIVEQLKLQGHEVERRQIQLKDPIKLTGKYDIKVRMVGSVEAHVKVIVEAEGAAEAEAKAAADKAAAEAKAAEAKAAAEAPADAPVAE